MVEVVHQVIGDSGDIPNNDQLPLILYKNALEFTTDDPDDEFQKAFDANGWGNGWRDQVIFSYHHYHSQAQPHRIQY